MKHYLLCLFEYSLYQKCYKLLLKTLVILVFILGTSTLHNEQLSFYFYENCKFNFSPLCNVICIVLIETKVKSVIQFLVHIPEHQIIWTFEPIE